MTDWSLGSSDISLMLDISVWDISGKKKSRFVPVAEPSVAIIVILSMEIAGIVILMSVTIGSVAAPSNCVSCVQGERSESLVIDVCGEEGEVVCEVENMMGLVRERLVMDRALVTPQPLVSGAGGGWQPRPGQSALMAAAGAFVLLFV